MVLLRNRELAAGQLRPGRTGFTLIELLIAIVILVVVATGVARFSANFSHAIGDSALRVVATGIAEQRLELIRADPRYTELVARYGSGAGADTAGFPTTPGCIGPPRWCATVRLAGPRPHHHHGAGDGPGDEGHRRRHFGHRRTVSPVRRTRHGFSLVELLIAMTMLLAITAAAWSLFQSQSSSFRANIDRWEMVQNARTAMEGSARVIRTMGAGTTPGQPILVYGGDDVLAFNSDYVEADTTDMRWAAYFNPDAPAGETEAWDAAAATVIPNSSPAYTYPSQTYSQANGAASPAETYMLYFAPDVSTARPDDYVLYQRVNNGTPEVVAHNILPHPDEPPVLRIPDATEQQRGRQPRPGAHQRHSADPAHPGARPFRHRQRELCPPRFGPRGADEFPAGQWPHRCR